MSDTARRVDLWDLTARDVMTTDVVTISEHDSLAAACELLSRGAFHHLPVVRGRACVGMVDERLILRAMTPGGVTGRRRVADILPSRVLEVSPRAGLHDVARLLRDRGRDAVVVVEDGELLGVLTAADLVAALATDRS